MNEEPKEAPVTPVEEAPVTPVEEAPVTPVEEAPVKKAAAPIKTAAGSIINPPLLKAHETNIPGGAINGTPMSMSDEIAKRMKADEIATKKRNDEASKKLKPAVAEPEKAVVQTADAAKAAPTV